MKQTVSIKEPHIFRRLYAKGKSAVSPTVAVYCRRNGQSRNRLGLTVGVKVGKAVRRNKVRRRIREAYRIHEGSFLPGWDIVVVARVRANFASFQDVERDLLRLMDKLNLVKREDKQ